MTHQQWQELRRGDRLTSSRGNDFVVCSVEQRPHSANLITLRGRRGDFQTCDYKVYSLETPPEPEVIEMIRATIWLPVAIALMFAIVVFLAGVLVGGRIADNQVDAPGYDATAVGA